MPTCLSSDSEAGPSRLSPDELSPDETYRIAQRSLQGDLSSLSGYDSSSDSDSSTVSSGSFYLELGKTASIEDARRLIENHNYSTEKLVNQARRLVETFETSEPELRTVPTWFLRFNGRLEALFRAMLDTADECGGPAGLRYVVSAICACQVGSKSSDIQATIRGMTALGLTWFAHLLWPFKISSSYSLLPPDAPDNVAPQAIPTRGVLISICLKPPLLILQKVLLRQNYRCALTGTPKIDSGTPGCRLEIAHVLKRSVCQFQTSKTDLTPHYSGRVTWDIL
ncbi:uncharacterized protein EV420DRAFT_1641432 [Desarmillaria tabescens]|uniref:HNH nuclease domain-containing protein n=1 Tax=Armillaria tabescens TaxID=1929756 RepID=A0AA39KHE6_ARMTA|nr:uncharacterized protein EV420DRAFT_1641432 [Desarmillaria tabescens]KAK0460095.1 hypothetical protein EV420DRAFT_1641432 [Desarmillaria tabescens]